MENDSIVEKLQEELAQAKDQAAVNLAGWQRAKADYSNLVKDQDKKYRELAEWSNAMLMAEVLPIYNHFKLALKHAPEAGKQESWLIGIEMIRKQFQDFLSKYKIAEIATLREKFDPNLHEAMAHEVCEGFAPDTVFEEVQPGYLLDGKVLLPAKVKVAK